MIQQTLDISKLLFHLGVVNSFPAREGHGFDPPVFVLDFEVGFVVVDHAQEDPAGERNKFAVGDGEDGDLSWFVGDEGIFSEVVSLLVVLVVGFFLATFGGEEALDDDVELGADVTLVDHVVVGLETHLVQQVAELFQVLPSEAGEDVHLLQVLNVELSLFDDGHFLDVAVDFPVYAQEEPFSFGHHCGLPFGTVQQTDFPKGVAHLVVLQDLEFSSVGLGVLFGDGAFEKSVFNEVHAIPKVSFADDHFFGLGLHGHHAADQELLVFLFEVLEQKTVHEVEPQHYLGFLVLLAHAPQTDRLPLTAEILVCLRTHALPLLPHHVLPPHCLPPLELFLRNLFKEL